MICMSVTSKISNTLAKKTADRRSGAAKDERAADHHGRDRLEQIGLAHFEKGAAHIGAENQSQNRRQHR